MNSKLKGQESQSTDDAKSLLTFGIIRADTLTAVQLVFNPYSQLVPQLELYSQLKLSLRSDPVAFSVPKPT